MKGEVPVPKVVVIQEGYIIRERNTVLDASSTVTMVESGRRRLVVDTGAPQRCSDLRGALSRLGLRARDFGHVVNTHLHVDHCGCNELFSAALMCAHKAESPPLGILVLDDELFLMPGVTVLHTPGHTPGSISVLVEADRRYAICGDAIPTKANYDSHSPPFINVDRRLALKSMDALLAWADMVVPGHGGPFEVLRKK